MTDTVAAVVATLVALAFSLSTFERYLARRTPHELAWSVALGLFAIASGALAVGVSAGWSGPVYRLFFLFGAIVNVPVLALGTIYLLGGERAGRVATMLVALGSTFAAGVVVATPFKAALSHQIIPQGSKVFPALPQVLAGVGSGVSTTLIVVGALYSALRRRRGRLVGANLLIAAGTLVTGASGLANSALDRATAFSVALGLGITIIFIGFLVGSAQQPAGAVRNAASPPR